MQRIVTLENCQIFELPSGEFTVEGVTDNSVTLISENLLVRPIQLRAHEPCSVDDIKLTFLERHENSVHVRVDSAKQFVASEMSVGGFDDSDTVPRADTVVVIAHR